MLFFLSGSKARNKSKNQNAPSAAPSTVVDSNLSIGFSESNDSSIKKIPGIVNAGNELLIGETKNQKLYSMGFLTNIPPLLLPVILDQ